jgi:hypothetical protein
VVDKTHVLVKEPEISVRYLADFMAASERRRRSIVEGCKYRPIARVLQHQLAQVGISATFLNNTATSQGLKEKAESIRRRIPTDDFDALTIEANADYVEKFSQVVEQVDLPKAEILPGKKFPPLKIHGVKIRFSANLMVRRVTKANILKRGAMMFRYAKGKPLKLEVGEFQSAAIFGLLSTFPDEDGYEADKPLCITLDAVTGTLFPAPSKSVSMFANMKAACQTIAERWPNIPPPKGALL